MKKLWVFLIVLAVVTVGVAAGLLTWLLLRGSPPPFTTIQLGGEGFGTAEQRAAYARIQNAGDMFWWFYESQEAGRPLLVWLDGVTGTPASLASIAMLGPYDDQLNWRNETWVTDYNLLFIDAPLGTGFSTASGNLASNIDETTQHLVYTLESFFSLHEDLAEYPVYIFGQGHGAQLALALAIKLQEEDSMSIVPNLQGVALGNAVVAPSTALSKMGFYLEQMGYIYAPGRSAIDVLAEETQSQVDSGDLGAAFDSFLGLEDAINAAGAISVNPGHIVEKLTRDPTSTTARDYFGQKQHISKALGNRNLNNFMDEVVAPALGIYSNSVYDDSRDAVVQAFRDSYMAPAVDRVEYILQNTNLKVAIYNGNLDAVSNTPGQLDWVDQLQWPGQAEFTSSPRQVLVVDSLVQGYMRESPRLQFYWVNVAGLSAPLDSPRAMKRILSRIAGY